MSVSVPTKGQAHRQTAKESRGRVGILRQPFGDLCGKSRQFHGVLRKGVVACYCLSVGRQHKYNRSAFSNVLACLHSQVLVEGRHTTGKTLAIVPGMEKFNRAG